MSIYVISNELAEQNHALVKEAGITDVLSDYVFVTVVFEDFDYMVLGVRARVRNNTLRIVRSSVGFGDHDCLDINLAIARIRHLAVDENNKPDIKPEYQLPLNLQPLRPVAGVRWLTVMRDEL